MVSEIYKISDVDFTELKFSKNTNNSSRRFVAVYYNKKPLTVKLPQLRVPFQCRVNDYDQLEVNLSLGRNEELIKVFKNIDQQMKNFAIENNWFIDNDFEYSNTLRESDSGYPPTIRLKINNKSGVINTTIYDKSKKKLNVESYSDIISYIPKGSMVYTAMECVGVWFNNKRFGLTWKANQFRVMNSVYDDNFIVISSDEEDNIPDSDLLIDDEY